MCVEDAFPAIKWFSETDQSSTVPPVTCYRVSKQVNGFSFSDWASWAKLGRLLEQFPP